MAEKSKKKGTNNTIRLYGVEEFVVITGDHNEFCETWEEAVKEADLSLRMIGEPAPVHIYRLCGVPRITAVAKEKK
jgi:hypothetical protein